MQEHVQTATHTEKQDGPSTRPKQLRNREVPWEGSPALAGSKLMSRRTDLSAEGRRERNSAQPKARRAERAGASESTTI